MRIAFFLGRFPVLSETFILSQITGLIDRGHDVEIFAGRPDKIDKVHPEVTSYGLLDKTHYWPSLGGGVKRFASALVSADLSSAARALGSPGASPIGASKSEVPELALRASVTAERGPFDAIVSHFGHVGRDAQMLRDVGALSGKLVTFFHAYDVTVYLRERGVDAYRRLFEAGDLFLPISRHWKYRLEELGCPPERTRVHHMGIDCERFAFEARQPDDGTVRMMSVARFVEKKGLYYALRAFAEVCASTDKKLEYHLVGDGELRPRLERLVEELGITEQVQFLGWRTHDEVAGMLDRNHILLAPSVTAMNGDTEGIPMVLMEAMARGLPVVSSYHTGIPELVDDGQNGALVPERDVAGLAARLRDLVEAPERWEAMGREGRAKVERAFNIETLNDRLESHLRSL